jgi:hypothetical protein
MKKNLFILITLSFLIYSCKNNKTSNQPGQHNDTGSVPNKNVNSRFFVDNTSKYSHAFLDSLKTSSFSDSIKLIKNYIVAGKDTATFPEDLKLDHDYIFIGEKDSIKYSLTTKRINLTDIVYNYIVKRRDSTLYKDNGTVTLNPMFFLGSENPDDNKTGESYSAFEYMQQDNNCLMYIGIGLGLDDNKKLRAYIKKNCKDNKLAEIPKGLTLRADTF